MSNVQAPSYQAVLLGQVFRFEDLSALYPVEENAPEGALILLELDLNQPVSAAVVAQLNQAFLSHDVPPWPGQTDVVFRDPSGYAVYCQWQKGQAQLLIGIGLIAAGSILPSLFSGGLLSFLVPSGLTSAVSTISGLMTDIGIMVLMMSVMSMLRPMISSASSHKPEKTVATASPASPVIIEEVRDTSSLAQGAKL